MTSTLAPDPPLAAVPSLAQMRERCDTAERQVRRKGFATEDEVAQYRPSEGDIAAGALWPWCYFYAQLVRFLGREEVVALEGDGADSAVLAALEASPVAVAVSSGDVLQVHPKSLGALLEFHARERQLLWITARYAAMRSDLQELAPEMLDILPAVADEISRHNGLLAWMATHDGPGVPYDVRASEPPALPAHIVALDPIDLIRINQAFVQVNTVRLQALDRLVQQQRGPASAQRPSWSVFVGALAMKWQADPKRLMWDYSLATLLATVKLATPPPTPESDEVR